MLTQNDTITLSGLDIKTSRTFFMKEIPQTSTDLSPRFSRRDFLKMAGVAGVGLLFAQWMDACGKKPAQEKFRLMETIDLAVPGLTAEKYKVEFDEITIPFWIKWQIQSWSKDDKNNRAYQGGGSALKSETWWQASSRCGSSFTGRGPIKLFGEFSHGFYFDGNTGRFYENVFPVRSGGIPNKAELIEREILGWPEVLTYWGENISCNGKVLYNVYSPSYNDPLLQLPRHAMIITDIPNSSKVVIKDKEGPGSLIVGSLTDESNKLLLSFHYQGKNESRGTYLIDLSDLKVIFQSEISSREPYLSKDESLLYLNTGRIGDDIGYVFDTKTGEKKDVIEWPTFLTAYEHIPSPDLKFIACKVGVFAASTTAEGQWGIFVHTPEGIFYINSSQKSLVPEYITDDGTLYTYDCILKFVNGKYQLFETSEKDKFEVLISKVSDD